MASHCTPPPSTYKPFWCCPITGKGVSLWAGIVTSKAGDAAEEGISHASSASLATGAEALGATSSGFWGVARRWWQFGCGSIFGRGGEDDMGECNMATLKSPYRPSTSNPATAISIFPNPSISSHCASSLSTLVFFSRSKPLKKRVKQMGSITKIRLKREQGQNGLKDWTMPGRKKDICHAIIFVLLFQQALEDPPTSIHDLTTPNSCTSFISSLDSSPLSDSSASETSQDIREKNSRMLPYENSHTNQECDWRNDLKSFS